MAEKEREVEHRRRTEIEPAPESVITERNEPEVTSPHTEEDYKGAGDELRSNE